MAVSACRSAEAGTPRPRFGEDRIAIAKTKWAVQFVECARNYTEGDVA